MKELLGMSIDSASEHHAVINVKVGVQENLLQFKEFNEKIIRKLEVARKAV